MMDILLCIITLVLGVVFGYLFASGKLRAMTTRAQMLEGQLKEERERHEREVASLKDEFNNQTMKQLELMKEQLTTASEHELKSRTEDLVKLNKEQLDPILNPLNNDIRLMKEAVERSQLKQTEMATSLKEAVKHNIQQTEKLGDTTNSLVNALSHDNKYQGGFGEMQLRHLLESFGLVNGIHFEEQVTVRDERGTAVKHDETGRGMQPDVVLHFPDHRDIIIDAKTSMTAFLRYNDTSLPDAEREQALKDHITAIRTQVRDLSKKDYSRYYNENNRERSTLDFVVMFIPSEGAMQLAMANDTTLWREAYEQKVFITGPQNLYALLQLLDMSWKQELQKENQDNIIRCANDMVKRVQMFNKRYTKVRDTLRKAVDEGFHDLDTSLADGGQSIITSARKLLSYGATENKKYDSLKTNEESLMLEENIEEEE